MQEPSNIVELPEYVSHRFRKKANAVAREVATAFGLFLLVCLGVQAQPKGEQLLINHGGTEAQRVSIMPALPKPMLTGPPALKTNGVQWFSLKPGRNPNRLVANSNQVTTLPDDPYLFRVAGLANGTKQTFVVTNADGASNIAVADVFAETNRITQVGTILIYSVPLYPNLTNWLVSTTNFNPRGVSVWTYERMLGTNGGTSTFAVTNTGEPLKVFKLLAL